MRNTTDNSVKREKIGKSRKKVSKEDVWTENK